jgi:hypothetical protein
MPSLTVHAKTNLLKTDLSTVAHTKRKSESVFKNVTSLTTDSAATTVLDVVAGDQRLTTVVNCNVK